MERVAEIQTRQQREVKAWAYCPICTHVVETPAIGAGRRVVVKPGQKCPRCQSALEAASVIRYEYAA
jgi:hypothetical protein